MIRTHISLHVSLLLSALLLGCGREAGPSRRAGGAAADAQIPNGISWASLLRDASDLTSLATLPSPEERSVQFSSSAEPNKASLSHLAPEVLGDMDHGSFLRVEDRDGSVEATLAEASGAGAITWIWSANPVGSAALYIDSTNSPALLLPFKGLLAGAFLPVRYPFASFSAQGHNLNFPIVHTNSFRLAVRVASRKELGSLFYHVAWNALPAGPDLHPFDLKSVQSSPQLLGELAARFTKPRPAPRACERREQRFTLGPGAARVLLQADQPGLICQLVFAAESKAALADLWIEACWDGGAEPAVRCPLSMLAGVSERFEDTDSLPSSVSGRRATLRWPMPFGPGSTLSCSNQGAEARALTVVSLAEGAGGKEGPLPLRLFANDRKRHALSLTDKNIVALGELSGPGRIAGCCLRVDSRSPKWWGEGDEIIWLDRYDRPAWRGTGTEDYFGFAWCSDQLFHHPLRGQTRADGSRSNRRIASMHRYHLVDRLPFQTFAKFEMEAWGLDPGYMDYETTLIGYAPVARPWSPLPPAPGATAAAP